MSNAQFVHGDQTCELPQVRASVGSDGYDISTLLADTGDVTLDVGFGNTAACQSAITYIDGDAGILRYRGYPIEQLAERSTFLETSYLVLYGELPTAEQLAEFTGQISEHYLLDERLKEMFKLFPRRSHPMPVLAAGINALSTFAMPPVALTERTVEEHAYRLMAKVPTLAAYGYKNSLGLPTLYPDESLGYIENFLRMSFGVPTRPFEIDETIVRALDVLLILHADHEQNCSTSTVRMVGSSGANLYLSVAAGVSALSGQLHGGANQAVIEMLQQLRESGQSVADFVARVKDKKSNVKLMGFGHRIYKNFDPRAQIVKQHADAILRDRPGHDELLDLALALEEAALNDDYFAERKLYPNVDFYTGLIYQAMGFPVNMFTVLFTIGRLPGWIAHWREQHLDPVKRIGRPRQVYTGEVERDYLPLDQR
ncbi:citrate synthase [Micropruina sonneratiae]|uniref:citrate synthase n=1 Tax=Micropruina sonneratiae TaxID=2986940 RepID=UPI0022272976|nr:citrate synthase [Micropruina sp. KQZ13P-5]MCW3159304.1 citrate synthase [Micropruina sp. KQZ13P-5]